MLRGKDSDACGQLYRRKFVDGFTYPWHVNGVYGIHTVIQGTLVLPAGAVMQGLTTEPHYGRAIGDTIFDVYVPCKK